MRFSVLSERTQLRFLLGWGVLLTLLLVQRPLAAPNLWWHLAQGREVVSGTFFPSRELLSLERANDADWLSGVPWYLTWMLGGNDALSVVPLLSAIGLLAYTSARVPPHRLLTVLLGPFPLMLVGLRDGLQPVPQWFDLLGMLSLCFVLESPLSERRRCFSIFLIFVVWGNLGPRPIWGLLWLLVHPYTSSVTSSTSRVASERHREIAVRGADSHGQPRQFFLLLIAALLGGIITPRGIWTWRDSAILFAPSAFEDLAIFGETAWYGSFQQPTGWDAAEWAFLLLGCTWISQRGISSSWIGPKPRSQNSSAQNERGSFLSMRPSAGISILAALLCRGNLPVCSLWIVLDMLRPNTSSSGNIAAGQNPWRRGSVAAMFPIVLVLAFLDAWGFGPFPCRRFGWGIAYELTPQLLDARLLSNREQPVVGWAPDGRSVGIVTWLDGSVTLADHPQRALLGGRGAQHASLINDFLGSHRARYRRDDGTWGGWVRQLSAWNVEQLFVPAEQQQLTRALLTTTWKPVDLDSPTIPFVSAHDARFSPFVLEVLQQRGFVEAGPWQPTAEIYAGAGWRTDFVELLGGGPDPAPAILQSQLFRSLDIPMASLRALLPIREHIHHWQLTAEFRACQNDLVYQEWNQFGEASEWRRQVVHSWITDEARSVEYPWLMLKSKADPVATDAWRSSIAAYLDGRMTDALRALPRQTSQQRYAAAMLWLELGNSGRAYAELEALASNSSEPEIVVAAKSWRELLEPFAGRSMGNE